MSDRRRLLGRLVSGALLVALIVLLERRYALSDLFAVDRIAALLRQTGTAAPLVFIGVMALAVIVSPIPSLPLDILAGRVFGPLPGGLVMVALFFLLPRWIERFDPFGMKRHFEHPGEPDDFGA